MQKQFSYHQNRRSGELFFGNAWKPNIHSMILWLLIMILIAIIMIIFARRSAGRRLVHEIWSEFHTNSTMIEAGAGWWSFSCWKFWQDYQYHQSKEKTYMVVSGWCGQTLWPHIQGAPHKTKKHCGSIFKAPRINHHRQLRQISATCGWLQTGHKVLCEWAANLNLKDGYICTQFRY